MARDRTARPEAAPLRLFLSVEAPEEVLRDLDARVAPLRPLLPGARWTRPEGWHVTLKFLGATWPRLLDEVRAAAKAAARAAPPLESWLTEVGAFPSAGRARVLWVGLSDPDGRLTGLASDLDERLRPWFTPERRAFTAHLTLARLDPPRDVRVEAPDLLALRPDGRAFVIDRLVLYRSHLSPRGATYEALGEFPLGTAAGEA